MKDYRAITNADDLQRLVDKMLADGTPIGFDIETGYEGAPRDKAALHPEDGMVVGFSFTNSMDWAVYVPVRHELTHQIEPEAAAAIIKPMTESGLCVAHNAKFEKRFLRQPVETGGLGIDFVPRSDTIIEAFVLAEWERIGLKPMTLEVFAHKSVELADLFPELKGAKLKQLNFATLSITPEVVAYACEDAIWCLGLHMRHYPRVKDDTIFQIEMAIIPILVDMEEVGLKYDWPRFKEILEDATSFKDALLLEINADLTSMVGTPVDLNPNSSAQVGEVLYKHLGMSTSRQTKTGNASTDAVALTELAQKFPVVQKILNWRELNALISRYLNKYPTAFSYARDGRTHPNIKQTTVKTGRFAVEDPPYQQTPKKYDYTLDSARKFELDFRTLVIAEPGWKFLYYDYSQIELRVMAGESQEPSLLEAFNRDEDVHIKTAGMMLNKPEADVTYDDRAVGKTMNFALLYGMGAGSLADRLGIDKQAAKDLYNKYFSTFVAISAWADRMRRDGKGQGYTISKFGRKFTIWEFQSAQAMIQSKGDRLCVNAPIQGGAADYMKVAMVRAEKALTAAGLKDTCRLVMNNHDSLTFEIPEDADQEVYIKVLDPAVCFEIAGWPKIVADWATGTNWGNLVDRVEQIHEVAAPALAVKLDPPAIAPEPEAAIPLAVQPTLELKDPERVVVDLTDMPTAESFVRFIELLDTNPGKNSVTLRLNGEELPIEGHYTNLDRDSPHFAIVLPGARVVMHQDDVDLSDIAVGLDI